MEKKIIQTIYASAATHEMEHDELEAILDKARSFNTEHDISGMLIYHAGSFIQILEGPEEAVEPLLDKIEQDSRHHLFKLLFKDEVQERDFEGWSMGFVDTTGMAKSTEGFVEYEEAFNAALNDKGRARKVLERFKEGTWRQFVGS